MSISMSLNGLLGILHPVLLAPMDVVSGARLTAAVSNAGGFGILGGGYGERAWLEQETAKLGQFARAPFGVGFITWSLAERPQLLDAALAHAPAAIMLSFGDAGPFIPRIKDAGIPVICQVQTVAMAREVLRQGADIIIAQGGEAGGHGSTRRGTLPSGASQWSSPDRTFRSPGSRRTRNAATSTSGPVIERGRV